uniref:Uncharacterized protein n=1 Tax=Theileria annulata TaxID=5874 RepID=A0A3B0MTG4_THEAN
MDNVDENLNFNDNEVEDNLASDEFRINNDNVISLTQSLRTALPSQVIFTRANLSDKSDYYEEWLQKCVAWIALDSGVRRMDFYSLEKITNFVTNHIKALGRKATLLSRTRGCETTNFVDVMKALEEVDPTVYNYIFKEKLSSKTKQLPKKVPIVSHNYLTQPVALSQPSALYFQCMINATELLSELNSSNSSGFGSMGGLNVYNSMSLSKRDSDGKGLKPLELLDMEYFLTYTTRTPYSFKMDEVYQKIVASRPKFLHKHMPLLPPEFIFGRNDDDNLSYDPDPGKQSDSLMSQNILLQSDLPMLHRVQIEPDLQHLNTNFNTEHNAK